MPGVPVVIERRYNGPPDSGHGGWSAGQAAVLTGAPVVEVTLRRPPPLERALSVVRVAPDGARPAERDPRASGGLEPGAPAGLELRDEGKGSPGGGGASPGGAGPSDPGGASPSFAVEVCDGEAVVLAARPATLELDSPPAVGFETAAV